MIQLNPIKTPLQFEQNNGLESWKETFSEHGGLDVESGAFVPLRNIQNMLNQNDTSAVNYVLDSIAGASEYGSINLETYPDFKSLFARPREIKYFLQALEEYAECFWLNERHMHAFFNKMIHDEMDCISYASIANWLEENAE